MVHTQTEFKQHMVQYKLDINYSAETSCKKYTLFRWYGRYWQGLWQSGGYSELSCVFWGLRTKWRQQHSETVTVFAHPLWKMYSRADPEKFITMSWMQKIPSCREWDKKFSTKQIYSVNCKKKSKSAWRKTTGSPAEFGNLPRSWQRTGTLLCRGILSKWNMFIMFDIQSQGPWCGGFDAVEKWKIWILGGKCQLAEKKPQM